MNNVVTENSWFGVACAAVLGLAGVVVSAMYQVASNMRNRRKPLQPYINIVQQTVQCSPSERDRVTTLVGKDSLQKYLFEDTRTCYESIRRGLRVSNDGPCLGHRVQKEDGTIPYEWISYSEVINDADHFAQALIEKGIPPGQQTRIGIYAVNRPEWIVVEHACFAFNMVTVPLYDTLGPDASTFIISQAEIPLVVVDSVQKAEGLISKHEISNNLRMVVLLTEDVIPPALIESAKKAGNIRLCTYKDMIECGKAVTTPQKHTPPNPSDIATLCYTSGTTGTPKGVILTHANVIAATTTLNTFKYCFPTTDDVMISYLPLAHMFERIIHAALYQCGSRVGFFRGDVKLLTDDIKELRPTLLPVVPRLLNRIYDKVMSEVEKSALKKCLFNMALKAKASDLEKHIVCSDTIWDKLIFKKVQQTLGGRVRLIVTGSAPCSGNVLSFIRAACGAIVLEGYGQTECAAVSTVSVEGDSSTGHVGAPIPCNRIKLVDVPDMNYYAKDNVGEVCIKGPNVTSGYFKEPDKTAEAIDSDGWLHTGDIGKWTDEGKLMLVDRKKHIFKLAQGEYIAPEKIESVYNNSKFVAQAFVYGESLKSSLVAVIVPDSEVLVPYAHREGHSGEFKDLCRNETIKKLILDDMLAVGKKFGLASFEQVKDIYIYDELFSVDNGLLTPTFKSKRPAIQAYFKDQIAEMYKVIT